MEIGSMTHAFFFPSDLWLETRGFFEKHMFPLFALKIHDFHPRFLFSKVGIKNHPFPQRLVFSPGFSEAKGQTPKLSHEDSTVLNPRCF